MKEKLFATQRESRKEIAGYLGDHSLPVLNRFVKIQRDEFKFLASEVFSEESLPIHFENFLEKLSEKMKEEGFSYCHPVKILEMLHQTFPRRFLTSKITF